MDAIFGFSMVHAESLPQQRAAFRLAISLYGISNGTLRWYSIARREELSFERA